MKKAFFRCTVSLRGIFSYVQTLKPGTKTRATKQKQQNVSPFDCEYKLSIVNVSLGVNWWNSVIFSLPVSCCFLLLTRTSVVLDVIKLFWK